MKPESALEKVAGNAGTVSAATLLAAFSGTPLAALIPALSGALASQRHKERLIVAIAEIEGTLRAHESRLKQLTDAQYKIINESVLALFQTIEQKKIEYLKTAIRQALYLDDISALEADALSRILRDISPAEAKFILDNKDSTGVQVGAIPENPQSDVIYVPEQSADILIVSGLISMGLLIPSKAIWGAPDRMMFSPICKRIRTMIS